MATPPLILVVDDSPIQCKLYSSLLKSNGYQVITGSNGRQAIDLALEHRPDLILMDITMPEMDGIAATRELRTHPDMQHIPIIAITATTDPEDLERARDAGYSDAVDKAADRGTALAQIQQWLG
jgi:CheY-like chemotaxis protein